MRDHLAARVAVTALVVFALVYLACPFVRWAWRMYGECLDQYERDLADRHGGV